MSHMPTVEKHYSRGISINATPQYINAPECEWERELDRFSNYLFAAAPAISELTLTAGRLWININTHQIELTTPELTQIDNDRMFCVQYTFQWDGGHSVVGYNYAGEKSVRHG